VNFTQMVLNTQMIVKMEFIGFKKCSIEIHLEPVHTQIKKKLIMRLLVPEVLAKVNQTFGLVKGNGNLMDNSQEA